MKLISFSEQRIKGYMTTMDALVAMSEGNPGAVVALTHILEFKDWFDSPDSDCESLCIILDLDFLGIYGHKIHMLFKDVCGFDLNKVKTIIDNCRSGKISVADIHKNIEGSGHGIPFEKWEWS